MKCLASKYRSSWLESCQVCWAGVGAAPSLAAVAASRPLPSFPPSVPGSLAHWEPWAHSEQALQPTHLHVVVWHHKWPPAAEVLGTCLSGQTYRRSPVLWAEAGFLPCLVFSSSFPFSLLENVRKFQKLSFCVCFYRDNTHLM